MTPLFTASFVSQAIITVLAAVVIWRLYRRVFRSSPFDNIPGPSPTGNWFSGHARQLFDRNGWEFHREINNQYGQVVRFDGMFGQRWLLVFDPLALHSITVKDQHVYEETSIFLTFNGLLFGEGLLSTLGERHRKQRKLLNPIFSIKNLRDMVPIFYRVTDRLRDALVNQVVHGPQTIDMSRWMMRVSLELVGQGGLGYSFDPLTEDIPNAFADGIKSIGAIIGPMFVLLELVPFFSKLGSARFRRWMVERVPYWRVQKLLQIVDALYAVACEIVDSKKAALKQGEEAVVRQIGEGKDIISKLLRANMTASEEDKLPDEEVIAQLSTLVSAASETTSGALTRILHLLAEHPDVQERLRREILHAHKAHHGGDLSYDQLSELPYLDAVCRETLRLYPPLIILAKTARQDTVLPLSTPICGRDGKPMHDIQIPNDTTVIVGILASNRNPALWGPNADEWKPERWLSPLPEAVANAHLPGVYSNLMTFFGGGRGCIGFKFAQIEIKVVLATLLPNFTFTVPTDLENPIVWNIAGTQYPTLGYQSSKNELPLEVAVYKHLV